jgi:hypothetical protein
MIFLGSGKRADYPKTSNGTLTLALADPSVARNVLILVTVTETFANGSGAQPTFQIGEVGTIAKFAGAATFTGLAAGAKRVFSGTLSSTKDLIVTATAGTGTATGAIKVKAVIISQTTP